MAVAVGATVGTELGSATPALGVTVGGATGICATAIETPVGDAAIAMTTPMIRGRSLDSGLDFHSTPARSLSHPAALAYEDFDGGGVSAARDYRASKWARFLSRSFARGLPPVVEGRIRRHPSIPTPTPNPTLSFPPPPPPIPTNNSYFPSPGPSETNLYQFTGFVADELRSSAGEPVTAAVTEPDELGDVG